MLPALPLPLNYSSFFWGNTEKRGSPALLKLSAPMKSTPENVVTEPLDKEKKGGGQ